MHNKSLKLFCYIDKFDNILINNLPKKTHVIYRNYKETPNLENILKIKPHLLTIHLTGGSEMIKQVCNIKEDTKIIDLLTHRAGMFAFEDNFTITNEDWTNWNLFVTKLAKQKPFYTPGSTQSYHALTFGFLVGEVVRRVDGRSLGTYFKEKIADNYNIDFIFGLGNEDINRTSDIVMSKIRSPILAKAFFSMPTWLLPKRIRPVVSLLKESDFQKAFFNTQTEKN